MSGVDGEGGSGDEPYERLSSDDLLREAHEKAVTPASTPGEGTDDGPDRATDALTDEKRSAPPAAGELLMVVSCDIRPTGRPWTRLQGRAFALLIDDRQVADIATVVKPDSDGEALLYRRTSIYFVEDQRFPPQWDIAAHVPGPWLSKKKRFGEVVEKPDAIRERVVTVVENPQTIRERDRLVASSDGLIPVKPMLAKDGACAVVADGTRFMLSPPWKASLGSIDDVATLRRSGRLWFSGWSFTAREPVPLSVVMLHWHLLLGDWRVSSGGAGGGG